jgi:hypothetical protein
MAELEYKPSAERAHCPGCGAALDLSSPEYGSDQAHIVCQFCGTESLVVRRLLHLEPPLPDVPPPDPPKDPTKNYDSWGTAALVWGIINGTDEAEQIKMAKALNEWPHSNMTMANLLVHYVGYMLKAPPELDKAMRGVIGKLICSNDLKLRNMAIRAGQRFGFTAPGSHGLLFALSLGDAATVKLLLEIAEWASGKGLTEYAQQALYGVQTAIGRERNYRQVCNQILLHRLPYVHGQVADWIVRHIRNEMDVGFRQPRPYVLELMEAMHHERPDLLEPLATALAKCRQAENADEYHHRLQQLAGLRTPAARKAALKHLGRPPTDLKPLGTQFAVTVLEPLLKDPDLMDDAARELGHLMWVGETNEVPPPLEDLMQRLGDNAHRWMREKYNLRKGIR